jgi:hypothetical protein
MSDLASIHDDARGSSVSDRGEVHAGAHPASTGAMTRLAYAQAKAAGVDVVPILKKTHLTLPLIEDPAARLRVRDQINFLNLVAGELQDDFLGFRLALKADLREIGWLYYVAASSETMSEALQRAARYSSIVNEGISLRYADKGDIIITVRYVGVGRHSDRHQIEFIVAVLVRMCRQLTGLRLLPTRVQFIHRRERPGREFAELFGSDIEFGAAVDGATFATATRNMPIVSADPYLNKLLIAYCEEAISRKPHTKSHSAQASRTRWSRCCPMGQRGPGKLRAASERASARSPGDFRWKD